MILLINRKFLNCLLKIIITLLFYVQIGYAGINDFATDKRVKLNDINTLTFTNGLYTTGRRLIGIPQLKCLGGTAGCRYSPTNVQCYNRGYDGIDINWECKAELDSNTKFGSLRVSCEGYDHDTDPYILAGSCGLEYTIDFRSSASYYNSYRRDYFETSKLGNFLTLLVMLIIVLAVYKSCTKFHENNYDPYAAIHTYNQYEHEYTGYDQAQFPAPPPPYGFRNINQEDTQNTSTNNTTQQTPQFTQSTFRSDNIPNENGASRSTTTNPFGGFWTGAAAGGIAGYMFGRRSSSDSNRNRSGYDSPPPAYEPDEEKLSTGFATTTRR